MSFSGIRLPIFDTCSGLSQLLACEKWTTERLKRAMKYPRAGGILSENNHL